MKILRVRLDDNLDRVLDCLKSERHVNVSAWGRSLRRAGTVGQLEGAAPGVAPLPETPPAKAPPLRSWSPYKLEDGSWDSSYQGETGTLPENLIGYSIENTLAGGRLDRHRIGGHRAPGEFCPGSRLRAAFRYCMINRGERKLG